MSIVVLIGTPNVGKSVIFNHLTGTYATVSNYPGTTVDILRGKAKIKGDSYEIIDTPGIYSLIPITEEERVTRNLLTQIKAKVVVHVIDAKNIRRMLSISLQLIEAGLPVILDVNMVDEAKKTGMTLYANRLSSLLNIPVVETSAVRKLGLDTLKKEIGTYTYRDPISFHYSADIESVINAISQNLSQDYGFTKRMLAIMLISGDECSHGLIKNEQTYESIVNEITSLQEHYPCNLSYIISQQRQEFIDYILKSVVIYAARHHNNLLATLGRYSREPLTGIPILCFVLYFGLYLIVGKFGAGFLVDYMDRSIFSQLVTPWVEFYVRAGIPWEWLQTLIVGEYGVFTLGIRYAMVIILPIVGTFFLVFAFLEDTGYLPRLAMLVDSLFKHFGLNGRAIIPITLGTGCGTMAVMVTRTLETRRERILATFLLALTIPCSAQLGVILSLLSHNNIALGIWACYITMMFIMVGWISAKLYPGEKSSFYIEIPPLRLPLVQNILKKAWVRMVSYFVEILPIFLFTSFIMWLLDRFGVLSTLIKALNPFMLTLGLPQEITPAFLFGFFRRDYGAAGLYDLSNQGLLSDNQLLVAAITLTLFVPCVAQLAVMIKERGFVLSLFMVVIIAFLAFASGWFVQSVLTSYGIVL